MQAPHLLVDLVGEQAEGSLPVLAHPGRRAKRPDPRRDDVEIVKAPEEILDGLEPRDERRQASRGQVARQLHGVPELLRRDADRVQALGHVERAGGVHGGADASGTAIQPAAKHRPGGQRLPAGRGLRRGGHQRGPQALDVHAAHGARHHGSPGGALLVKRPADLLDRAVQRRAPGGQFVQQANGHVQLADAAQRARDAADGPGELPESRRPDGGLDERKRFPEPARRHPRVVHAVRVGGGGARHVVAKSGRAPAEREVEAAVRAGNGGRIGHDRGTSGRGQSGIILCAPRRSLAPGRKALCSKE